jgi:hypothetical protein
VDVAAGMEKTAGAILHVKHFQFGLNATEICYSRLRVYVDDDVKAYSPNQDRKHPVLRFFDQTRGKHQPARSFQGTPCVLVVRQEAGPQLGEFLRHLDLNVWADVRHLK